MKDKKLDIIPLLVSGLIFLVGTTVIIVYAYREINRIFASEEVQTSEVMTVYLFVLIIILVTFILSAIGYILTKRRLKRRIINE